MSQAEIAQIARDEADESPELRRITRELWQLADEALELVAQDTRLSHQRRGILERFGQLSEALRVVTTPPMKRKRPAPGQRKSGEALQPPHRSLDRH